MSEMSATASQAGSTNCYTVFHIIGKAWLQQQFVHLSASFGTVNSNWSRHSRGGTISQTSCQIFNMSMHTWFDLSANSAVALLRKYSMIFPMTVARLLNTNSDCNSTSNIYLKSSVQIPSSSSSQSSSSSSQSS